MPDLVKFAAYVLAYFLVIYLTAIRRGGQPLLPWLFLILVQALSVFYYETVVAYIRQIPFLAQQPDTVCQAVAIAGLALLNLLMIFLVNILFQKREVVSNDSEFEIDVNDVPIMPLDWDQFDKPLQHSGQTSFDTNISTSSDEELPDDLNIDDEEIFQKIQELTDSGNREAAIKYLRMVVYFGKKEIIVEQAKRMLTELQAQEE